MNKILSKYRFALICLVLAVAILAAFGQVHDYGLVNYDDDKYITDNPSVKAGLTHDSITWAFTTGYASNWHPLTWLSMMLDIQLFGTNSGGYHLTSLFFHILTTLLLFAVLKQMTGAMWRSAFVAGLFALHPLHVESVVWISERKDVLSTMFWVLTMIAYLYYVRNPGKIRYFLTLLVFALGLMAKPMLVTLPFVLLLLDYWPLERLRFGRDAKETKRQKQKFTNARHKLSGLILEKVPFLILSVISSFVTFLVQQKGGAMATMDMFPMQMRIMNAVHSYLKYIEKMIYPVRLAVFYPPPVHGFPVWQSLASVLTLLAVSTGVIYLARKHKYLCAGWFWYVGTLVPVIGLVQVGSQSLADRYTYVPLIGLFIMIAWGLPELLAKWKHQRAALGAAGIAAILVLSICTYGQVGYWRDSVTLFEHALKVTTNNFLMHNDLGFDYLQLGRQQEAIEAFRQAIKIKLDYAEAYYNLGIAYSSLGRSEEAIEAYKQAITIKPDYAPAHYNLGLAYGNLGRWQEAIEAYKQAIEIKPDHAGAHNNLGAAYLRLGRLEEAAEAFKQTIRIKADYPGAYNNLGLIYGALGRWQESAEAYRQAITIKPDYADAYYGLGIAYSSLGRWQEAIEAYKQTVKIKPDDAEAHYNLGAACLEIGDKDSAVEESKILRTLDGEKANQLFNRINNKKNIQVAKN
jgi:tetratricopeptide (TPR) repeat protein